MQTFPSVVPSRHFCLRCYFPVSSLTSFAARLSASARFCFSAWMSMGPAFMPRGALGETCPGAFARPAPTCRPLPEL